MRKTEQRERVLALLAEHLLQTGLAKTSLRQLAAAAEVSDRMLIYYFGSKAEVLSATTELLAARIVAQLAAALPGSAPYPPADLARRALAVTASPEVRPFMRLWIAIVAAAARREPPYEEIAKAVMGGFQAWLAPRVALPDEGEREAAALAIVALCDGIALIELCAGEDSARKARSAFPLLV